MITPESIASGEDKEIARVVQQGKRGILFLEGSLDRRGRPVMFGVASCLFDDEGGIAKIYGVTFIGVDKLDALEMAVATVRKSFEAA